MSGITLWQFLLDLLLSPPHAHLIRWTSDEGEFKLLDAETVAKLWGLTKNHNEKMNYDKLSRALRYYYRKNIIQKVLGQKFVYRFVSFPEDVRIGSKGSKRKVRGDGKETRKKLCLQPPNTPNQEEAKREESWPNFDLPHSLHLKRAEEMRLRVFWFLALNSNGPHREDLNTFLCPILLQMLSWSGGSSLKDLLNPANWPKPPISSINPANQRCEPQGTSGSSKSNPHHPSIVPWTQAMNKMLTGAQKTKREQPEM